MEFPMYISLSLKPGYKEHMLKRHGFGGEYELFKGNVAFTNDKTYVTWDGENYPIKGIYICEYKLYTRVLGAHTRVLVARKNRKALCLNRSSLIWIGFLNF